MVPARHAYRPPAAPRVARHPMFVYWRRRVLVALLTTFIVVVGYLGITLGFALTNQSYGVSFQARFAEWGRQHGLGAEVTWAESEYYRLNPAKVGGAPPLSAFGSGPTTIKVVAGGHLAAPKTIPTPAATPLPGEGVWHVIGRQTASGLPTAYEAFVRPDAVHTSYVVGVVWMDPTLLQAQLYSGSSIPGGGPYPYTAPISAKSSESLVAAFNAGFLMPDANGGYYTAGKTVMPLRNGAASVVIFKDGTMTVAKWGRDATMSNQVASVRQNLDLIVDNGRPVPGLANASLAQWGFTLGGAFNVWRSGLGVTKDGALVYVGGPSLSISALANVLVRAGAVRAMELDINTDWVQYSYFNGALNTPINGASGTPLMSSMIGPPTRYFESWWTRDFFTMSLRPSETGTSSSTTTKPKG
jgi:uncharacterized protein YigE (DUF2233 family)